MNWLIPTEDEVPYNNTLVLTAIPYYTAGEEKQLAVVEYRVGYFVRTEDGVNFVDNTDYETTFPLGAVQSYALFTEPEVPCTLV